MARRRNQTHSVAFREEAVRQARESPKRLTQVARDLGVNYGTLRWWLKDAKSVAEDAPESTVAEVRRLRKEVRALRLEREILKKAMAFFAKHTR